MIAKKSAIDIVNRHSYETKRGSTKGSFSFRQTKFKGMG